MKQMEKAIFKALIRPEGSMVAALAVVPSGHGRFFVVQKRESAETFIGRVTEWIKEQDASGVSMEAPDVLPKGVEIGAVLLRIRSALGVSSTDQDNSEFDIQNAKIVLDKGITKLASN